MQAPSPRDTRKLLRSLRNPVNTHITVSITLSPCEFSVASGIHGTTFIKVMKVQICRLCQALIAAGNPQYNAACLDGFRSPRIGREVNLSIVSMAIVLFFVMDPLGNLPVFSSVLERVAPERRRRVLARELCIALAFLIIFLFVGRKLLELLHLQYEAIRVGGGIVLFLIALRLIFPPERGILGDTLEGEPLVFPLAVPLIAGPSAFATILFLVESGPDQRIAGLIAIVIAWAASAAILLTSSFILRVIGKRGILAMERLMGMLLVMLAIQMVLEGGRAFLAS